MKFILTDSLGNAWYSWGYYTEEVVNKITTENDGIENRIAGIERILAGLIEKSLVSEEKVAEFLTEIGYGVGVVPHKER